MQQVGIRELKTHLSTYVSAARAGESTVITDRGVAVARLVPITSEDALEKLIAEGIATRPSVARRPRPAPIDAGTALSDLVIEQRG
ncbi:type II toxin-antitoxin system Phd/YefM family antitoxin [Microbacterium sp. SA39]|uniref:type II toxin-antitoxin system Phd/YefM family antitoxin n=1 Tax=Microbacterium sp. SA39 TaxID=1263625 RepID=UPI0005F9A8AB|nr:type II toxin-antitoxin system prevent-host-death family antitoxin [Microbacterium sp. SA39]KJQ54483.1 Antitoxin VapB47 [Microbacterium sp. SA39]